MKVFAIECRSLGLERGSKSIFKNLDCSIEQGHLVSLPGDNGVGKTSFLRLCAGLERPTQGWIKLRGQMVADEKVFVPARLRGIGFVFQDFALFEKVSVRKNILYGCKTQEHRDEAQRLIKLMGLEKHLKKFPGQLSGGERQKVALARSLALKPDIMFLDEPFSSIDQSHTEDIIREIKNLFLDLKITAILVTHNQHESKMFSSHELDFFK